MSKVVEEITDQAASSTLTKSRSIRWLAPELLSPEGSVVTPACDVYSFSMTILECLTLAVPFSLLRRDIHVVTQVLKGAQPPKLDFPALTPPIEQTDGDALWELMTSCWALNPEDRPTMDVVYQKLLELRPENLDVPLA